MRAALALLAFGLLLAGCGGSRSDPAAPTTLLPRAAVPALPASDSAVTSGDLAADLAGGAAFEHRLAAWGFVRGSERVFQGESHRIDRVVSRSLVFRSPRGARRYVDYVGAHAAALYGAGTGVDRLASRGRSGYLLSAAACACHRAEPTMAAVVARRSRVTWLEANGGAVDRATMTHLLDAAP